MKKYLIILPLLLAASIGTLIGGHIWLNSARDQVELTEYVLDGDPAAAGVTVTFRARDAEGHLNWETTFTPGGAETAETAFAFSAKEQPLQSRARDTVSLYTFGSGGYLRSGRAFELEDDPYTPVLAFRAVADRTPDGTERTETVRLADYYEYYPIVLDVDKRYYWASISSLDNSFLGEYFRLKVPEDKQLEIMVRKDDGGNIVSLQYNQIGEREDWVNSSGVITDRGIYMIAESYNQDGISDNRLQCRDGSGVHFIPVRDLESEQQDGWSDWWDVSKIRLFYPTGDARTLYLGVSPDESKLLLYTQENNMLVLTILDAVTGEALQRLDLVECEGGFPNLERVEQNDLYFVMADSQFCLIAETGGRYQRVLTGETDIFSQYYYYLDNALVAWDGKHMAIAAASYYCSFYNSYEHNILLGVWDQKGLLYLGGYDYGISRDPYTRTNLLAYQSTEDPFSIRFTGNV